MTNTMGVNRGSYHDHGAAGIHQSPRARREQNSAHPCVRSAKAAAAHEMLALRTLDATTGLAEEGYEVSLWGAVAHPVLDRWAKRFGLPLCLQAVGDLGRKMQQGLASVLDGGASQALLIGSDCPVMTTEYIRQASTALQSSDLVLGPAEDGGYVLIGCKRAHSELFANITWGSDTVLAETLERAEQLMLTVTVLEMLWDVDRPEDWARFQRLESESAGRD